MALCTKEKYGLLEHHLWVILGTYIEIPGYIVYKISTDDSK